MALKIRKDIKKSSYYVWFLGAKESKGLRGKEYILPVIDHLVQREKDIEPFKVTLQISHKGLKIIQNVLSTNPKTSKPKNETIKHFIPHNTITCVYQDEDLVSCILLLFNPVTKCPLHVHVYRCDSVETASLLKTQLEVLIERPENQKKFSDLESRVKPKEKKKFDSSLGSDTGTSTRESESSEERYSNGETRIATLYDSLAAELRQKLGKNESPILLPPRDYDTVHRQKGNLQGIDLRRCLNTSIVGQNAKGQRKIESSGGSSGIGSDHAPSPDSPDSPERFNMLDNQSTSDEEWNVEPNDSTMYLMHGSSDMILPRAPRHVETSTKFSPEPPKSPEYRPEHRFDRYADVEPKYQHDKLTKDSKRYDRYENGVEKDGPYLENSKYHSRYHEDPKYPQKYEDRRENGHKTDKQRRYYEDFDEEIEYKRNIKEDARPRSKYIEDQRFHPEDYKDRSRKYEEYESRSRYYDSEPRDNKQRSKYPNEQKYYEFEEKQHEFYDPKLKYIPEERHYYPESKTLDKNSKLKFNSEDPRFYSDSRQSDKSSRSKYSQDEVSRGKYSNEEIRSKYLAEEISRAKYEDGSRGKYSQEDVSRGKYIQEEIPRPKFTQEEIPRSKYTQEEIPRTKYTQEEIPRPKYPQDKYTPDDYFDEIPEPRRRPEDRQRSGTPEVNVSPRDRFKDAKEKFLLLERERLKDQDRLTRQELHNSTPNLKDKTFLKRHESMLQKDRYVDERHYDPAERYQPKPAPRTILEEDEVRFRREVPLDRYRSPDRYEKNRRSMFNQIEEEHKKNSNEIAKELKRRSYMESNFEKEYYRDKSYQEVADGKRYPGMDRDAFQFSKSNVELDKVGEKYPAKNMKIKQPAGYRHSYAEPKLALDKLSKKHYPDMVHRTNSSVSNSGRVGLASVNPY